MPMSKEELEQKIKEVYALMAQVSSELRRTQDTNRKAELKGHWDNLNDLLAKLMGAQLRLHFKRDTQPVATPTPVATTTPAATPTTPIFPRKVTPVDARTTRTELIQKADMGSAKRSELVTSILLSVENHNTLVYQSATLDNNWLQTIQMNLRKNMVMYGIKQAIDGPLYVHCDCPAFKWWGFEYICTARHIVLPTKGNNIYPKIRNPRLIGTVCKHLIHVLTQLPQDAKKIYNLLNAGQPWVS
jgi:hypothetical protein